MGPGWLMLRHITYRMAAQINEYSMVHGNRKGDASCTSVPMIFVRRHSNMWWGPFRPRGIRTFATVDAVTVATAAAVVCST